MSNPKAVRDLYLRTLYDMRREGKLTQRQVVGIKSILDSGVNALYNQDKCIEKLSKIKELMWGPGGCDVECADCHLMSIEKVDPEMCIIKSMRLVFDPSYISKGDGTK